MIHTLVLRCSELSAVSTCYIANHGSFYGAEKVYIATPSDPLGIKRVIFDRPSIIRKIPSVFFGTFPRINEIELRNTSIRVVTRESLALARNVEAVQLDRSKIRDIQDFAFEAMTRLRLVNLFSNELLVVFRDTFSGAPKIEAIDLQANQIERIEDGAFSIWELKVLNLSDNRLRTFSNAVFGRAYHLKELYLARNHLTHIGQMFFYLNRLTAIDLSGNVGVDDFNLDVFAVMPLLRELHLAKMGLHSVPDTADGKAWPSSLLILNLAGNHLHQPNILRVLLRLFGSLRSLNLQNNDFDMLDEADQANVLFPGLVAFKWQ